MTVINIELYVKDYFLYLQRKVMSEMDTKDFHNPILDIKRLINLDVVFVSFYKHPEDYGFNDIYLDEISFRSGLSLSSYQCLLGDKLSMEQAIQEISESKYYKKGDSLESFYKTLAPILLDYAKNNIDFSIFKEYEFHFKEADFKDKNEEFYIKSNLVNFLKREALFLESNIGGDLND